MSGLCAPVECGSEGAKLGQRHTSELSGSSCQVSESHEMVISWLKSALQAVGDASKLQEGEIQVESAC